MVKYLDLTGLTDFLAKLRDTFASKSHTHPVDSSLSSTSTNPVQNKVVNSALSGKVPTTRKVNGKSLSTDVVLSASDVGAADSAHNHNDIYYTESEMDDKLSEKAASVHTHSKSQIIDFPASMPASDVPAWAKAAAKPTYTKSEVGLGNVDNTADADKSVKHADTAETASYLNANQLTTESLNNIKATGAYYADGDNTVTNKPSGVDAFGLTVQRTSTGYINQILIEGNASAGKTWTRQFNASSWSDWGYYYSTLYKPTPSDIGAAASNHNHTKSQITDFPTTMKNPSSLTISLNGASQGAYDGSVAKSINITPSSIGAAASSHTHTKSQIADFPTSMPASDVSSWAKASTKPSYSYSEITGTIDATSKLSGVIPAANLPGYVDDVIEGYYSSSKFYKTKNSDSTYGTEIAGEAGKIYTDLNTNKIYRWSGSAFAVISDTIALGETSSTAYRGDRGKVAYDHSQETGNPHGTTKSDLGLGSVENKSSATIRGELTKANVTTALGYTPPTTNTTYPVGSATATGTTKLYSGIGTNTDGTMTQSAITSALSGKASSSHTHTKSDVGLGNVDNTADADKSVKYATSAGSATSATSATTASSCSGNAATATKLAISRTIQTNLGSASPASFNGSANIAPGVTGILPIGNGGTGTNTVDGIRTNIGINPVTTAGTGAAYTATVNGITSLTAGVKFTMIPHTTSTDVTPTLNVNGLGAKNLRMRLSGYTSTTTGFTVRNFLVANKPVDVMYDGIQWVIDGFRPNASGLYGTVPVSGGGTGATDAATARDNLGVKPIYYGTDVPSTDVTQGSIWIEPNNGSPEVYVYI